MEFDLNDISLALGERSLRSTLGQRVNKDLIISSKSTRRDGSEIITLRVISNMLNFIFKVDGKSSAFFVLRVRFFNEVPFKEVSGFFIVSFFGSKELKVVFFFSKGVVELRADEMKFLVITKSNEAGGRSLGPAQISKFSFILNSIERG